LSSGYQYSIFPKKLSKPQYKCQQECLQSLKLQFMAVLTKCLIKSKLFRHFENMVRHYHNVCKFCTTSLQMIKLCDVYYETWSPLALPWRLFMFITSIGTILVWLVYDHILLKWSDIMSQQSNSWLDIR